MFNLLPHKDMAWLPGIKQAMGLDIPEKAFQRLSDFIKPTIEEHRKSLDENDIRFSSSMHIQLLNCQIVSLHFIEICLI